MKNFKCWVCHIDQIYKKNSFSSSLEFYCESHAELKNYRNMGSRFSKYTYFFSIKKSCILWDRNISNWSVIHRYIPPRYVLTFGETIYDPLNSPALYAYFPFANCISMKFQNHHNCQEHQSESIQTLLYICH